MLKRARDSTLPLGYSLLHLPFFGYLPLELDVGGSSIDVGGEPFLEVVGRVGIVDVAQQDLMTHSVEGLCEVKGDEHGSLVRLGAVESSADLVCDAVEGCDGVVAAAEAVLVVGWWKVFF